MTTILVTHDKEEALMSSDKIAFMLDGQIKQFGTPEELYQRPNSIEVAHFLGEKNFIRRQDSKWKIPIRNCKYTDVLRSDANHAKLMIKPEDIGIFPVGTKDLEGTIQSRKYAGERVYYTVVVMGIELKIVSQSASFYNIGDQSVP